MVNLKNMKRNRESKRYTHSRVSDRDYLDAEDRWEMKDLQEEMAMAEPVDLDEVPMIYGDEKKNPNEEDEYDKVSFEPGQLGGTKKRNRKQKNKYNRRSRKVKSIRKYKKSKGGKSRRTRRNKSRRTRRNNKKRHTSKK